MLIGMMNAFEGIRPGALVVLFGNWYDCVSVSHDAAIIHLREHGAARLVTHRLNRNALGIDGLFKMETM